MRPFNVIDTILSGQIDEEIHVPECLTYSTSLLASFSKFQHVRAHNVLVLSSIELVRGDNLNVLLSVYFFMLPGYVLHAVSMVLEGCYCHFP